MHFGLQIVSIEKYILDTNKRTTKEKVFNIKKVFELKLKNRGFNFSHKKLEIYSFHQMMKYDLLKNIQNSCRTPRLMALLVAISIKK